MKTIDCDFHIHSRFSSATSNNMTIDNISRGARQKGLDVVSTGDGLNKFWLEEIESLSFNKGIGKINGCYFVLTTEVEDINRVHHLIMFKDLDSVHFLKNDLKSFTPDIDSDGRPHVRLKGWEIAELCHKAGALFGPSHAFVPWTSIYKEFNTLNDCYGDFAPDYLELGLSAETSLANRIDELKETPFLSNSDAHSPSPHRLGREFNRLEVDNISFDEIKKAIKGRQGRAITLNVGLDPRLGKYHRTSCIKCFTHFSLSEALTSKWKCPDCGGRIKKGVRERIGELQDFEGVIRPPYLRIAPLAEIISKVLGVSSVYSKKVGTLWNELVDSFGSEIAVLIDVPIEQISDINSAASEFIRRYREGKFAIREGGGGRYGEISFDNNEPSNKQVVDSINEAKSANRIKTQSSLDRF